MTPLRWVCVVMCSGVVACASGPTQFDQHLSNASSARQVHDTRRQMRLLESAFQAAKDENEQAEALYRKAHAWLDQRAAPQGMALLFRVALGHPLSDRAARAWLDLGRAYDRKHDDVRAERCYLELVARHPSSGSAIAGAQSIAQIRAERGVPPHLTYASLRNQTTDRGLQGAFLYFEASALKLTAPDQARGKFQELVRAFPLPDGPYSDEARLQLALLLRAEHQPQQALLQLKELQKYDRSASFVGSYTRRSYLDSYLLAAQILRDDLQQFDAATKLLKRALKRHAQSAIVDDLYFELLLIDKRRFKNTCDALSLLLAASPRSKYRRCAPLLCADALGQTEHMDADDLGTNHCKEWLAQGSPLRTPELPKQTGP